MDDLSALTIDRSKPKKLAKRRRGGNPWPWRIAVLLILAGLVWVFYRPITSIVDRYRLPTVQVVVVEKSHPATVGAVRGAAANGYIVASRRAALSADTPGRIIELNVTEGTIVKKGDVVARLYFKEYEAALARAAADVVVATADVERAKAANAAAGSEVQRRKRNQEVARSQVNEVEAQRKLADSRYQRKKKLVDDGIESIDVLDAAKAELDSSTARLKSAEARLEAAAAEVTDSEHLVNAATASLRVAQARVGVAQSAEAQAAATLDKTYVRAPFDGKVVLKDAEVGEVVSPNSQGGSNARGSVCTMVDFDSLEVQADVPETSISSVKAGAPAAIYLDAFPGRTYQGRVSRIWPTGNRQKGSVEVRVVFLKRDDDLRPDMGVRVVFLADESAQIESEQSEPQILVPEEAVVQLDGRSGAFVLERDAVRFQAIELGERRGGQVAVLTGLSVGQRIVLSPPPDLKSGARVQKAN